MQQTLLEIVQEILSSMDGDEVNSINDTVESYQVAMVVRRTFYDMCVDLNLNEHGSLLEITASGDNAKPVLMTLPSGVTSVDWIKYDHKNATDTEPLYTELEFVPFLEFIERTQGLRGSSDVSTMTFTSNSESFEIVYRNNEHPTYFTTYDGTTLLFNAHKASQDTTLQKSKVMAFGKVYPTFSLTDGYTPDIDKNQFPYLINKAKARCFDEIKQQVNQSSIQETRRQKIVHQPRRDRVKALTLFDTRPKYGKV